MTTSPTRHRQGPAPPMADPGLFASAAPPPRQHVPLQRGQADQGRDGIGRHRLAHDTRRAGCVRTPGRGVARRFARCWRRCLLGPAWALHGISRWRSGGSRRGIGCTRWRCDRWCLRRRCLNRCARRRPGRRRCGFVDRVGEKNKATGERRVATGAHIHRDDGLVDRQSCLDSHRRLNVRRTSLGGAAHQARRQLGVAVEDIGIDALVREILTRAKEHLHTDVERLTNDCSAAVPAERCRRTAQCS